MGKRKALRRGMQRRGEGSLVDHVNDSIRKGSGAMSGTKLTPTRPGHPIEKN